LGFKVIVEKPELSDTTAPVWPLISAILLLYLSAANLLTWYAGVANTKLAMYIKVFHEDTGAEGPVARFEGAPRGGLALY
jgi:hypothetical protein